MHHMHWPTVSLTPGSPRVATAPSPGGVSASGWEWPICTKPKRPWTSGYLSRTGSIASRRPLRTLQEVLAVLCELKPEEIVAQEAPLTSSCRQGHTRDSSQGGQGMCQKCRRGRVGTRRPPDNYLLHETRVILDSSQQDRSLREILPLLHMVPA